ncbi:MAG: hypothetical protein NTW94_04620 [Legionellales bacterium]|nr:hypothetical protein [Legionellales bacterium]
MKETPENTPYSWLLLSLIAMVFLLLLVVQWVIADVDEKFTPMSSLQAACALLLCYGVYTVILLSCFRVLARGVQTLSCLLAGHTIVHLFAFPLLLVTPWITEATLYEPLAVLVAIVYLVLTLFLTLWQFMVTVHIYKHAFMITYFSAVLASFGLLACNIFIVSLWR